MRDCIDVTFFDYSGRVVAVYMDVKPGRRIKHKGAAFVVEGFSEFRDGAKVYKLGDTFVCD
jgi:hypothetical protein